MIRNAQDHFRCVHNLPEHRPYHEYPSFSRKRESTAADVQPEAKSSFRLCPYLQVL